MIVGFDLDDTLYPEITYVQSGFRSVAEWLEKLEGVPADRSFEVMLRSLDENGRGSQFDDVLRHWGMHSQGRVREAVSVYRHHVPSIELPLESAGVLESIGAEHPLYLITDGNHLVQARKVEALGVAPYFRHCYLTNRYGRSSAKPSTRTFELLLRRERADPADLVYVGDNPAKDFVGVRRLGGRTIRVLTGGHRDVQARPGFEADICVEDITAVEDALTELESR